MNPQAKRTLFPVVAIILSISISLIVAEIFLRLAYPMQLYSFEQGLFKSSEQYGYSLSPNVMKVHSQPEYSYKIRANSYGFRGREPIFDAAYRVLVLGRSYSMGQGVEEGYTLCDLSQRAFNEEGTSVDIFNTSISGYFGLNELAVLETFSKTYKPHLVILFFCWNDIGPSESLQVQNGYLVLNWGNKATAPLREWLNNNSHLYCLIKRVYYSYSIKSVSEGTIGINNNLSKTDMDRATGYVKKMALICKEAGSQFIVVLVPMHYTAEGSDHFRAIKDYVIHDFESSKIAVRDWAKVLPENNKSALIYKFDHHWNYEGHAFFSTFLTKMIREKMATNP